MNLTCIPFLILILISTFRAEALSKEWAFLYLVFTYWPIF
jgi:hypothetical protein